MFHRFALSQSRLVPVVVGTTVGLGTVYYLWQKERQEAEALAKKVQRSNKQYLTSRNIAEFFFSVPQVQERVLKLSL